jgi:hypothetical protein
MREDTTQTSAKATEATLETGLQEQGAKWDPTGARRRFPCCVFLHLLVFQINERRYNASIGEGHRSDLREGLQEQGANWDPPFARWRFPCCVFLHLFVFQINERRYNASIGEGHRIDLRDKATGTRGQMGPHGCQVEVCVFLHLLVLQINERRYNAIINVFTPHQGKENTNSL